MFLPIVKTVADVAASIGAGAVVGNLITFSTPMPRTLIQKITVTVGSTVVTGAVASFASRYVNEQIDSTVEQAKELKSAFSRKK